MQNRCVNVYIFGGRMHEMILKHLKVFINFFRTFFLYTIYQNCVSSLTTYSNFTKNIIYRIMYIWAQIFKNSLSQSIYHIFEFYFPYLYIYVWMEFFLVLFLCTLCFFLTLSFIDFYFILYMGSCSIAVIVPYITYYSVHFCVDIQFQR